jgi:BirA family biotin operon repressor/biotin-[acetyl-CoA-carboxylase] ligase
MTDHFTPASLRAALGTRPFRFHEQVESTQDIAREWARHDPPAPSGAVVIAEEQSAGRGRQGRVWLSPPESGIMCSIVLRPHIAPERLPRVTMAGGIAVAETLDAFLPGGVALKWPNDVLIEGRKVSGILTEATWIGDRLGAVILGIGINIRVDFEGTDLAGSATSLETELGRRVDRHVVLANLLGHVYTWMERIGEPALVNTWKHWLGTLGKRVTVYVNPRAEHSDSFEGIAEAVEDDGALLVRLESGEVRRIVAADVGLAENSG